MKNNDLNKNILRAISIGLAATLTLMPTVTAFADDGESGGGGGETSSSESHESHHESEHTEKSREASDSAREAAESDHHEEDQHEEHHEEEHHEESHEEHHEESQESSGGSSEESSGGSYEEPSGGSYDESQGGSQGETPDVSYNEPAGDTDPGTVSLDLTSSMLMSSAAPEALLGVSALQMMSGVSGDTDKTIELVKTESEEAQTAVGATQPTAGETQPSVGTLMNSVADTMDNIATQSEGVDNAVDAADGLIEEYEGFFDNASSLTNATRLAISYADSNTKKADEVINQATNTANEIKNAANGTYVSDEAKAAANETLDNALKSSNEAVGLAENNLKAAAEELDRADKAVKEAEAAKDAADKAVKEAKDKFMALLVDNGIEYKEDGDNIILEDGNVDKAVKDAEQALKQAQEKADRLNNAYNKACTDADTAISNASAACNTLIDLQENHSDILDNITNKSQSINSWDKARTLAYYMAEYYLVQIGALNADTTISVTTNDKGIVQNDSNGKGFTVTLKNADGTEKGTYKFNYRGISEDGKISDLNMNDPNKLTDQSQIHHIQLMLGDVGKTYKSDADWKDVEAIAGFEDSTSVVNDVLYIKNLSSEDINNQKEVINGIKGVAEKVTTDASLDDAKQNLTEAKEKLIAVNKAINAAKEILNPAENNYVSADSEGKISFNENTVFDTISDKQKNMENAVSSGNKNDIVTNCRDYAVSLVKYQLEKEGYTDIVYKGWDRGDGDTNNHFGWYQYKDSEGNIQNRYFDYVALSDESSTENILDIKNVTADTLKTISTIKVISKTVEEVNGKKQVVGLSKEDNKAEKCETIVLESTVKSDSKKYFSTQQQYKQYKLLESARSYAQSIVDKAQVIYDTKSANFLKQKVQDAKNKVDDAVTALKNAKLKQSVDQEYLNTLQQNLTKAQREYNTAKENLAKAKENRDELERLVNEAKSVVASQKKVTSDSHHKSHKSDDAVEEVAVTPGETVESAGGTGVVVDTVAATGAGTVATATGAGTDATDGVFTVTDTTFEGGGTITPAGDTILAAAPAAGGVEADVLGEMAAPEGEVFTGEAPDGSELESDVLGERMAPIVNAVNDGTFTRDMLFTDEAKKIPFPWWILFLVLGATGVTIYVKTRKKRS